MNDTQASEGSVDNVLKTRLSSAPFRQHADPAALNPRRTCRNQWDITPQPVHARNGLVAAPRMVAIQDTGGRHSRHGAGPPGSPRTCSPSVTDSRSTSRSIDALIGDPSVANNLLTDSHELLSRWKARAVATALHSPTAGAVSPRAPGTATISLKLARIREVIPALIPRSPSISSTCPDALLRGLPIEALPGRALTTRGFVR